MITNYARCPREIKYRIAIVKDSFNKKKTISPANWTSVYGSNYYMLH
jgi:hypothetical protein